MQINLGKSLALTAASGLVAGLAACGGEPAKDPSSVSADPATASHADAAPVAKECCKGKNDCKGKGNCKTEKNDCAGKNECKAQGGCKAADCKAG